MSKHFIDQELIHGVEQRMQRYTEINTPMEIKAVDDHILYRTAQGTLLVLVRDTDDIRRKIKLQVILVRELKINIISIVAAAQKGVKTVLTKSGSCLDFGVFSVQKI